MGAMELLVMVAGFAPAVDATLNIPAVIADDNINIFAVRTVFLAPLWQIFLRSPKSPLAKRLWAAI